MKRFSVFTGDLGHCIVTGRSPVHIHHIFGGPCRKNSERRGFIIPLIPELHNMGSSGIHFNRDMDLYYKKEAQRYYESHYGTRKDFIKEFVKSRL